MGTGQMILSAAALVLLGLLIIRVNNTFASTNDVMLSSKLQVLAISLGTSMLEEAQGMAFDEKTVNDDVLSVTSLTAPGLFGRETGETIDSIDDFDDYHNLVRIDSTLPSAVFRVACNVAYVNPTTPNTNAAGQTWHKRITVVVTSPSMASLPGRLDSVRMSSVFSYWHFR